jgi:CYTH domain-containing protein/predicted ATPase
MLKIVLTGGPCGGKSSALSKLTQILEERSYKVFTVWESATPLILNGIKPSSNISMYEFQKFILDSQIENEALFDKAAQYYDSDKVIVFYDRGIMDGAAYIDKETLFKDLLASKGITFSEAYNRYDAVLHLVTAADGAEKYYQWNDPSKSGVGNNAARSESPEEAINKDKKTLNAWIGHPHLRVFDNSTDFDGKVQRVIEEVFALLGEPAPTEVERKFLIKRPTEAEIKALGCISKTNIIQTYLLCEGDVTERRIRQRGTKEDGFSFYYTEKTDVSDGVRVEKERKITPNEYLQLLTEADTSLHQISKTRYCFVYDKQYFEMDLYPFSDEYAILEIELNNINDQILYPPLNIVKEVTSDKSYRNYELAKHLSLT